MILVLPVVGGCDSGVACCVLSEGTERVCGGLILMLPVVRDCDSGVACCGRL